MAEILFENCVQILDKISKASQKAYLLPVSKGQGLEKIQAFWRAFPKEPRRLGENYLAELSGKAGQIKENVEWHFLGRLQSRKLQEVCELSTVLHGLSRLKELEAVAALRNKLKNKPRFFVQVNISAETEKNGLEVAELGSFAEAIESLALEDQWLGLMGMAAPLDKVGEATVAKSFSLLRGLRDRYHPHGELSMGMSHDYEIALNEGANCLRIGSLIFGERGSPLSI